MIMSHTPTQNTENPKKQGDSANMARILKMRQRREIEAGSPAGVHHGKQFAHQLYPISYNKVHLPNFTIVLLLNSYSYLNCLKSIKCNNSASTQDRAMIFSLFDVIFSTECSELEIFFFERKNTEAYLEPTDR